MWIAKNWHRFETELRVLHINLLLEHVRYEAENLPRLKQFFFGHELVFLNQFQIQNVIDETEKQVDLRYDDEDDLASGAAHLFAEEVLEEHEAAGEWRAELV